MTGDHLEPEMVVGDRYRLCRLLGEGGMGHVWEAVHTTTGAHFALKFLKSDKDEDRRRFLREVRAAGAVNHPNVIAVHDFIELPDAALVIVMDLLRGETLGAVLRRDGRIELPALAAILVKVVAALEAAHGAGVVHRDLKPDNIFLCERVARGAEVKVLDFGVAKLTASDGIAARTQALTGTGSMVGTPYYMSPEQVFSDKDLDGRADVWSLGVVMYECLAGVRPTEADTIGRVLKRIMVAEFEPIAGHCPELPADVASLIGRMLGVEPASRPALAEVRAVLEEHAAAGAPSFSGARDAFVDPHAATVSGPGATPAHGSAGTRPSRPAPAAPSSRGEALPQADTNGAMAMLPARRARPTKRVIAAVAVALLGATLGVRQWRAGEPSPPAGPSSTAMPTVQPSSARSTPPEPPAAPPTSLASSEVTPKVASSAEQAKGQATPVATTTVTRAADAGRPGAGAGAAVPAQVASGRAAVVSAPACGAGEVPSDGHCCPRGHVWQSGRCQRPLATSF